MRTLIINLLATALLLLGASNASALGFQMSINPGSTTAPSNTLVGSELIALDIYMDAGPGLGFITVAVLYDDNGTVVYEPGASTMPSYILYTPGAGTSAASYMIPNVNPPGYWNGVNVPGKRQVNIEFLDAAFGSVPATGNGIWLATVVFHVANPGGEVNFSIALLGNGSTIVEAYTNDVQGSYTTTGSFTFGHAVPEPTTALLIGFGLVGLTMAGRRKD